MQISSNNGFCSFALNSTRQKCDVWTGTISLIRAVYTWMHRAKLIRQMGLQMYYVQKWRRHWVSRLLKLFYRSSIRSRRELIAQLVACSALTVQSATFSTRHKSRESTLLMLLSHMALSSKRVGLEASFPQTFSTKDLCGRSLFHLTESSWIHLELEKFLFWTHGP